MRVIVMKIGPEKPSKHGGTYRRVIFRGVEDNKSYRLDLYHNNEYSRRWAPYIREQAIFDKVSLFKGNIINGKGDFVYLGQRHPESK